MRIVRGVPRPNRWNAVRRLRDVPDRLRKRRAQREAEREFEAWFSRDRTLLAGFRKELEDLGLLDELAAKRASFDQRVKGETRGWRYVFGELRVEDAIRLYALVRKTRPRVVVETGVCNGFSSSFILAALDRNADGQLYSLDLPEMAGEIAQVDEQSHDNVFWEGKLGAVIPQGEQSGWIIPDRLRSRWHLTLGRTQETLPPLLRELGEIDFFFHDSEHSYECMSFEFSAAWPVLRPGGILLADDYSWNEALADFARAHQRPLLHVSRKTAFIVK